MGFWHTGYMEFHEPAPAEWVYVPTPVKYPCQLCNQNFASVDDLRRHRFENHRFSRPLMFIRGIELGATPLLLTRSLSPADIQTDKALSATVNGVVTALFELPRILSATTNDRVTVILSNEGANATFEILVRIAKEAHLDGVETAFIKMAKARSLTIRSIESFIGDCKPFGTADLYCDGLCHYLYGVLAKEQASDCALSRDEYPSRFTRAADELQTYERSLAKIVRALVAFNFNHFEDSHNQAPSGRLQNAAIAFARLLEGLAWPLGFKHKQSESNALSDLLTDRDTLGILRWTELGSKELVNCIEDLQGQLKRNISGYDKFKIQILLAEALAFKGDAVGARRSAREFMSHQQTQAWADALAARLSKRKHQK